MPSAALRLRFSLPRHDFRLIIDDFLSSRAAFVAELSRRRGASAVRGRQQLTPPYLAFSPRRLTFSEMRRFPLLLLPLASSHGSGRTMAIHTFEDIIAVLIILKPLYRYHISIYCRDGHTR